MIQRYLSRLDYGFELQFLNEEFNLHRALASESFRQREER